MEMDWSLHQVACAHAVASPEIQQRFAEWRHLASYIAPASCMSTRASLEKVPLGDKERGHHPSAWVAEARDAARELLYPFQPTSGARRFKPSDHLVQKLLESW
jgi:hypothetical protein